MARVNPHSLPTQATSFRKAVKLRLVELDLNVAALAGRIGKSRGATSTAINHESMLPGVKELIRKELQLHD